MRHAKRINHLSRTNTHRAAMLSNMASSLIKHKRISTTLPKAKELRKYVEPLVTRSKNDTTHSRRIVFSYLQDKEAVTILFREVSQKVATRQGGYTRILKTGFRQGDNAEMCIIELVDYNETYTAGEEKKKIAKTRRSKKATAKSTASKSETVSETTPVADQEVEEVSATNAVEENVSEGTNENITETTEATPEEEKTE